MSWRSCSGLSLLMPCKAALNIRHILQCMPVHQTLLHNYHWCLLSLCALLKPMSYIQDAKLLCSMMDHVQPGKLASRLWC